MINMVDTKSTKKRIIFWQSADLFNYLLANSLQNYELDLYAIIDITNKPKIFFQNQSFVAFKKIWFYHDFVKNIQKKPDLDYLNMFEKKYGINLWLLARNERIFFDYNPFYKFSIDEIYSILEQECKLFETILDEIKPDYLVLPLTTFHSNHLFYLLCKSVGVKILMITPTEFGFGANRFLISDELRKVESQINESRSIQPTFEELQILLRKMGAYTKIIKQKNDFNKSIYNRIKVGFKFLCENNSNIKTHYTYFGRTKLKVIKYEIFSLIKSKIRSNFIDKKLLKKIHDEDFIYFPLHVDEERSLLIGAPFYTNQLEVIQSIVKSTPIGLKVYVKEHPSMKTRNWRTITYYKELINIPNVRVIHHSVSNEDLIKKCKLVISIAGTAAFEAAFYEKPSIIFSKIHNDPLSSRMCMESMDDLPKIIRKAVSSTVKLRELDDYINRIIDNSFEFDYISFEIDYGNEFYDGGIIVDVKISDEKMNSYIKRHKPQFDMIAKEILKKTDLD